MSFSVSKILSTERMSFLGLHPLVSLLSLATLSLLYFFRFFSVLGRTESSQFSPASNTLLSLSFPLFSFFYTTSIKYIPFFFHPLISLQFSSTRKAHEWREVPPKTNRRKVSLFSSSLTFKVILGF
ncbi:unnamed protein product [Cuscuta epithymum]|uniref:Transmembrane protein n=1 Tax=Cuscuta epithymum TaxID=186058 RepID=A0AAV0CDI7_9ASTE|nr:unnamed protein product [Cuscuta epithymum]